MSHCKTIQHTKKYNACTLEVKGVFVLGDGAIWVGPYLNSIQQPKPHRGWPCSSNRGIGSCSMHCTGQHCFGMLWHAHSCGLGHTITFWCEKTLMILIWSCFFWCVFKNHNLTRESQPSNKAFWLNLWSVVSVSDLLRDPADIVDWPILNAANSLAAELPLASWGTGENVPNLRRGYSMMFWRLLSLEVVFEKMRQKETATISSLWDYNQNQADMSLCFWMLKPPTHGDVVQTILGSQASLSNVNLGCAGHKDSV